MGKSASLSAIKKIILENLETLQMSLVSCVEEGMLDTDDAFYNEVLDLIADVHVVKGLDELSEAIIKARVLEAGIAAFLARKGKTTLSLDWPIPD